MGTLKHFSPTRRRARQRQSATSATVRLTDGELLAAQYRSLASTFDEGAMSLYAAADALRVLAPALEQARTLADVPPDALTAAREALERVKDTQTRIGVASLTTFNR